MKLSFRRYLATHWRHVSVGLAAPRATLRTWFVCRRTSDTLSASAGSSFVSASSSCAA